MLSTAYAACLPLSSTGVQVLLPVFLAQPGTWKQSHTGLSQQYHQSFRVQLLLSADKSHMCRLVSCDKARTCFVHIYIFTRADSILFPNC